MDVFITGHFAIILKMFVLEDVHHHVLVERIHGQLDAMEKMLVGM
jgi:hypothetical protein